jgi:hypothetical protein
MRLSPVSNFEMKDCGFLIRGLAALQLRHPEQIGGFGLENPGNGMDDAQAGVALTSLDSAHVSNVQSAGIRHLLLTHPLLQPQLSYCLPEGLGHL